MILPGNVIGILGGGQLGRMLAISARQMGYRIHVFSPSADSPASQVADETTVAPYLDLSAIQGFAKKVQVLTFEFENIPEEALKIASKKTLVRPSSQALYITQHRNREKTFLKENGFSLTPYEVVRSKKDLAEKSKIIGFPCVLKTAGFGYDGKGQMILHSREKLADALDKVGGSEWILEAFVDLSKELSVIIARGRDESTADWGVVENRHKNHILDISLADSDKTKSTTLKESIRKRAIQTAHALIKKLDVIGVICVEFFVTQDGRLLVNEIAPRPHNSGHFSIDACVTSQFEQQIRAICGLPLGSTNQRQPAAMVNILGDLWFKNQYPENSESSSAITTEPLWQEALSMPEIKLHLYGKKEARPGRKMGHITATASTIEDALQLALTARQKLA